MSLLQVTNLVFQVVNSFRLDVENERTVHGCTKAQELTAEACGVGLWRVQQIPSEW